MIIGPGLHIAGGRGSGCQASLGFCGVTGNFHPTLLGDRGAHCIVTIPFRSRSSVGSVVRDVGVGGGPRLGCGFDMAVRQRFGSSRAINLGQTGVGNGWVGFDGGGGFRDSLSYLRCSLGGGERADISGSRSLDLTIYTVVSLYDEALSCLGSSQVVCSSSPATLRVASEEPSMSLCIVETACSSPEYTLRRTPSKAMFSSRPPSASSDLRAAARRRN